MGRKICTLFLLAAMLIATLSALAFGAENGGALFVVQPSAETVKSGDSFTVTVSLENNPGFATMSFTVAFDADKFTCTSSEIGDILKTFSYATNEEYREGFRIASAAVNEATADGKLVVLSMKAKQDCDKDTISDNFKIKDVSSKNDNRKEVTYGSVVRFPDGSTKQGGTASSGSSATNTAPGGSGISITGATSGSETAESGVALSDVPGHWAEDFINRAVARGLFTGYPDGTFLPDKSVSRAEFVVLLYRAFDGKGEQLEASELDFTDVEEGVWYTDALKWAVSKEAVNGMGDGSFSPDGSVTREQLLTILYRLEGQPADMSAMLASVYDEGFTDSGEISDWAKRAVYWGYYNEIIQGTSADTLAPKGEATRAQLAKILLSYLDKSK